MKTILLLVSGVLLLALLAGVSPPAKPLSPPTPLDPAAVLQDAADLVLLAVSQSCHVEQRVQGFVGNTTVAGDVRATVWIGTDLTQALIESIDETQQTLVLVLPSPETRLVALDALGSRVQTHRAGLWLLAWGADHEAQLVRQLFDEAQHRFQETPLDLSLRRRARIHAESVLTQILAPHGWKVRVRWAS